MIKRCDENKVTIQLYVDVQATMWGEAAKDSYYPINIPDYASNILGPRRTFYINKNRADRELLTSNVKVRSVNNIFLIDQRLTDKWTNQH